MLRSAFFVTALLTTTITSPDLALALPEAPVTGLPMAYDADNNLIGPYYSGTTYVTIGGQLYVLPLQRLGFPATANYQINVYYSKDDCKGDTYAATTATSTVLGLSPTIFPSNGLIFYATGAPKRVKVRSYITINMTGAVCQPFVQSDFPAFVFTKKPESFLGIKFPIRIDAPK